MRPESMHPGHRLGWPALAVLALVPLIAAVMMLSLVQGNRGSGVSAAVVNLDEAVTIDGQVVPLGRQLAAEMVTRQDGDIEWTLADSPDAAAGLSEGRYAAVVIIPENFSAAATSFSKNDAQTAQQATVQVQVSENSAISDAALAQQIASLATDSLNATLTTTYLENIYVGFNTVSAEFDKVVDGASQLNTGGAELTAGTTQAASGGAELATGLQELAAGGETLVSGTESLASGVEELADGTEALAQGSEQLAAGAQSLSAGVSLLNAQTPQLIQGANQLTAGAEPLLTAVPSYTAGTVGVLDGVTQIRDGLSQLEAGLQGQVDPAQLSQVQDALSKLVPALRQVQSALNLYFPGVDAGTVTVDQLRASAAEITQQLNTMEQTLAGYAQGTIQPPAEAQGLAQQLIADWQCPVADPDDCALLAQGYAQGVSDAMSKGFQYGAQRAYGLLTQADPRTGQSPLQAAQGFLGLGLQIGEALIQLRDALSPMVGSGTDPLTALEQLPTQLAAQASQLSEAVTKLREGSDAILTQAEPLRTNADQLASGSTTLLAGMQRLNSGLAELPGATSQLASGGASLSSGSWELAAGTKRLALGSQSLLAGADQLAEGASQYVAGVAQASGGAVQLSAGLNELDAGAGQLSQGLGQFHDQLDNAAQQLPNYDESARKTLASVVASPVAKDQSVTSSPVVPVAALAAVAAMWLGSLLAYSFAAPVPSDLVSSSRSSAWLWLRTLGWPATIGAGQGLVLGLAAGMALGRSLGFALGAGVLLGLLGVSFTLVNHALAAWLGNFGRGISVLLLVVTVGLGLTSRLPDWVDWAAALSPLQNGMLLIRTYLSDGSGMVALAGLALLLGVVALAASYSALAARRNLTPEQFRSRVAA